MDQKQIQQGTTFLTTEHFVLQGMRSGTIAEANGRLSNYLTVVSSALVALAFVAQISDGAFFLRFGLVILPILTYLGFTTCARLVQLREADFQYVQAMNRIHHFYLDVAPDAEQYLSSSPYDDFRGNFQTVVGVKPPETMPRPGRFHPLLYTTAGQVEVINSFIFGVFAALLARNFNLATTLAVIIGAVGGVIGYIFHIAYDAQVSKFIEQQTEFRFPTPGREEPNAE